MQADKVLDAPRLTPEETVTVFKFYEEAAEKTKAHAWSQTTWILTLNAGIFAFALKLYTDHAGVYWFSLMEFVCAGVGIALCVFLIYLLSELGRHISRYWTSSNKLAVDYPPLVPFIEESDAVAVRADPKYCAPFPRFCARLQWLAWLFLLAHIAWACFAVFVLSNHVISQTAMPGLPTSNSPVATPVRQEQK